MHSLKGVSADYVLIFYYHTIAFNMSIRNYNHILNYRVLTTVVVRVPQTTVVKNFANKSFQFDKKTNDISNIHIFGSIQSNFVVAIDLYKRSQFQRFDHETNTLFILIARVPNFLFVI